MKNKIFDAGKPLPYTRAQELWELGILGTVILVGAALCAIPFLETFLDGLM